MSCRLKSCFSDMPCMKRLTKTNRRRHTGKQRGTKSARDRADETLMNRGSTTDFVPPPGYIGEDDPEGFQGGGFKPNLKTFGFGGGR